MSKPDASVSAHLGIELADYDGRIRTFIPGYEEMLRVAADIVASMRPRMVVDLGTGTGALAAEVARRAPRAHVLGIDEDAGMLAMAERRLRRRASFVHDSFLTASLPACDAVMASLSLHHIASRRTKLTLYRRVRAALGRSGVLVSADCHPAALAPFAADGMRAWRAHLAHRYGPRKAAAFLRAWAREDFYVPLDVELRLLQTAGFEVDVAWRRNPFAVIVGQPRSARNHKRGTA